MIALTVQKENSSSSPLSLSTPQEEPTISFSELLKGVSSKKDGKVVQNGALVLSLAADSKDIKTTAKASTKEDSLLSLLKNDKKEVKLTAAEKEDLKEVVELNPKLASVLSPSEIKTLVSDAKEYLKSQILKSDDFKRSQIKDLPKTLKGLAEMAKKFGVDVSKITLEEVQPKKVDYTELKTVKTKEVKTDTESTQESKVKHSHAKEAKSEKTDLVADGDAVKQEKVAKSEIVKEDIKSMPLFKAQSSSKEYTTEQLVQTKVNSNMKVDDKSQKSKADETLKLLLRGEKPSVENPRLTADFSVATAKVIAPGATTETTKSLEKLLHGNQEESKSNAKVDGLATHKADSFEVKLNEAKQMIKYLSNDVKTAIEDYKAPFTRVKVQLNPQRLGEVDLTIVQRGKNLHVNISSNNTAINTLAMNANDLKTQLSNSGINNATLNFNNSSDSSGSNQQQQGQRQNQKEAHEEYNYFENEENNEEIMSSLEIVVPRYI
jgi:flagellar hook-length control protein FliK